MFQKAEIIFGCEAVMSYSLQEIMAYHVFAQAYKHIIIPIIGRLLVHIANVFPLFTIERIIRHIGRTHNFILDTHKLANNLTPMLPKPDKKNGRLKVIPEMIITLKKTVQAENIRAKELHYHIINNNGRSLHRSL